MKKHLFTLLLIIVSFSYSNAQEVARPNIVVILADDFGWADLSCYGSKFYETPNLDRLAKTGVRFTQNYATCPVCSPTRASMMTGKYPVNTGVTDWIIARKNESKPRPFEKLKGAERAYELALEEKTIAELALENNYKTFFAGKWHLGEVEKFWPDHQGFEINKGGWSTGAPTGKKNDSTGGYFVPYKNPKLTDGPPGEYLTDRLANECIDFISQDHQAPFFLMYSLYAVHNPMQAPDSLIKKYKTKRNQMGLDKIENFAKDEPWMQKAKGWQRRLVQGDPVYAAMVENMDWNIGRIITKLEQAGLIDNTLIMFTSDNGGLSTAEGSPTVNGPLRAGKGWLYEGGIRVPLIMSWSGKLSQNTVSEIPITTADFYPTLASLMEEGYRKDAKIDGHNVLTMLKDSGAYKNRALFWHYPHYGNQGGGPGSVIRKGNYKLIYNYEDKSTALYNLKSDISEQKNLAKKNKRVARKLEKELFKWLEKTSAKMPGPNPNYRPTAPVEEKPQDN